MKVVRLALLALTAAALSWGKPAVNAVVNAASWAIQGLPNGNVAPGSIIIIAGSGLGPTTLTQGPGAYPLVKTIAGVTATVSMGGTDTQLILFWVRNDYVAALLPSTVATGTGTITVTYNGETSDPAPVTVVSHSIGIFAIGQNGQGPGVVTDANKPQTSVATTLVTQTNSAMPNHVLVIWVTGLGAVPFDETVAPPTTPLNLQPTLNATVWVGSKPLTPSFAGPSGCCEGEGQIQVTLPQDVDTGCYVPVSVVTPDNHTSNVVTVAIDPSGTTCHDQFGFTSQQITQLQTSGKLRAGFLSLNRSTLSVAGQSLAPTEAASGEFEEFTTASFAGTAGRQPSLNTCVVTQFAGGAGGPNVQFTGLDAGPSIALTGPNGNASLPQSAQTKGLYSATLPSGFLSPTTGNFVFTGNGGADVGAFTATVPATGQFTWNNQASVTAVPRGQGLNITWSNSDPKGYVMIFGASFAEAGGPGESFFCVAPGTASSFTVPAWVLQSLPASGSGTGTLGVYSFGQPVSFTAPGLDVGTASRADLLNNTVTYQ